MANDRKRKAARKKIRQATGASNNHTASVSQDASRVQKGLREALETGELEAILTEAKKDPFISINMNNLISYASGEETPANGHLHVLSYTLQQQEHANKPKGNEAVSDDTQEADSLNGFWNQVKGALFNEDGQVIKSRMEQLAQISGVNAKRLTKLFTHKVKALDEKGYEETGKIDLNQRNATEWKPGESLKKVQSIFAALETNGWSKPNDFEQGPH